MQDHLRQLLKESEYLTIDQVIETVLVASPDSYYQQDNILGHHADFITAPEISQLFGEMIAIWVCLCLEQLSDKKLLLVELGPGRGKLMEAILRFNSERPGFKERVEVALVERSHSLRQEQKAKLEGFGVQISWHNNFQELCQHGMPMILVANEFFDALPIKQYIRNQNKWYERVLTLDQHDHFIFDSIGSEFGPEIGSELADGAIYERMYESCKQVSSIAEYILKHSGAALLIDYGYELECRMQESYVSTLQAIAKHQYVEVLDSLGHADLSAHVDFAQLKAMIPDQLQVLGPITQQNLLCMLGIELRLQQLLRNTTQYETSSILLKQYHRLMSEAQMGQLYKALAFSSFSLDKIFLPNN